RLAQGKRGGSFAARSGRDSGSVVHPRIESRRRRQRDSIGASDASAVGPDIATEAAEAGQEGPHLRLLPPHDDGNGTASTGDKIQGAFAPHLVGKLHAVRRLGIPRLGYRKHAHSVTIETDHVTCVDHNWVICPQARTAVVVATSSRRSKPPHGFSSRSH